MQASFSQNKEELVNLFFCSLQDDNSGELTEDLVAELTQEGHSPEELLKAQQEASQLFAKYCY